MLRCCSVKEGRNRLYSKDRRGRGKHSIILIHGFKVCIWCVYIRVCICVYGGMWLGVISYLCEAEGENTQSYS